MSQRTPDPADPGMELKLDPYRRILGCANLALAGLSSTAARLPSGPHLEPLERSRGAATPCTFRDPRDAGTGSIARRCSVAHRRPRRAIPIARRFFLPIPSTLSSMAGGFACSHQ